MHNQLFYGDNLDYLRQNIENNFVDLCYIDPPFNSSRNYNQIYNQIDNKNKFQSPAFIDIWTWDNKAQEGFTQIIGNYQGIFTPQSIALIAGLSNVLDKGSLLAYLVNITLRVAEIHRVLKPSGSFYLHCDPTASHYLKLVLDAIFCPQGGYFQNEIIWCYSVGGKTKERFASKHDVIFYYTKTNQYTFNIEAASISRKPKSHMKLRVDTDGREYQEKIERKTGKVYKYYLDEGKIAEDYWTDIETLNRGDKQRLGYPTQKPEALLERIIKVSSNEGDLVLDAYCGCGTTLVVAQRLKRHWIGMDITYQSISLCLKRFEDSFDKNVVPQVNLNGIPSNLKEAIALSKLQGKEFEKWAILTYSNNHAIIERKKDKNKSVDGIVYFLGESGEQEKIILQVKAGDLNSDDIKELDDKRKREQAAIAIFITLKTPNSEMFQQAIACGIYNHQASRCNYPRLKIVTIKEMLEEAKRLDTFLFLY